jgi:hypothetical protein
MTVMTVAMAQIQMMIYGTGTTWLIVKMVQMSVHVHMSLHMTGSAQVTQVQLK